MEPEATAGKATGLLERSDSLDFCEAFLVRSPMPTAVIYRNDHLLRCLNPAFCKLLGKSPHEVMGATLL